jgi:hypothetical protein
MSSQPSVRLRIDAAFAILTAALFVATLFTREWIELLIGVDPDGGSGAFEWAIVACAFVISVTVGAWGRAVWNKRVAVGS